MLKKLRFLYSNHFKAIIGLNILVSLFFTYLFFLKGFDKINLYHYAIIFKLVGYALSVMLEKVIFQERKYFYRNLRIGYRKIFSILFIPDFVMFKILLMFTYQFFN